MGQSSSQAANTSLLPGPQQKLTSNLLNSRAAQNALRSMPTNYDTKSRFAGQALSALGNSTPESYEDDDQSYSRVSTKFGGNKYTRQPAPAAATFTEDDKAS